MEGKGKGEEKNRTWGGQTETETEREGGNKGGWKEGREMEDGAQKEKAEAFTSHASPSPSARLCSCSL